MNGRLRQAVLKADFNGECVKFISMKA
jgi:hypothetical protein